MTRAYTFFFIICLSLTSAQIPVCSTLLLRFLQQQTSGLLQAKSGDERYCRKCLTGTCSHYISCSSSAVNGCRQNESPNSWKKSSQKSTSNLHDSSPSIKGVVDCNFTFLTLVSVMLLFEHKQYLQSCGAESSMQTEMSFKILAV